MSEPVLKTENLSVRYGEFIAVSDASIELQEGSITALIGANGAGKSTLLGAFAGLHAPSSGRILFKGEDITGLSPDRILERGLSLVPQGGRCFTRMTVEDNLLMGSYPARARKKAAQSLKRVYELFPVLHRKRKAAAGTLSGGERQMTAIGRALMACPECILFDEISLGLAPIVIGEIYTRIRRINEETGTTVLLVEQDTRRALGACDTCFVMLKGQIVLSGRPGSLSDSQVREAYFGL